MNVLGWERLLCEDLIAGVPTMVPLPSRCNQAPIQSPRANLPDSPTESTRFQPQPRPDQIGAGVTATQFDAANAMSKLLDPDAPKRAKLM